MKRITALILVLAIFMSFSACKKPQKEMKTDIVGEWMAVAINAAAVFNEDGTGELTYNGQHSATWTYDPDQDRYIVNADKTYTVLVGKEYDMPYMNLDGADFYSSDDYGNAHTLLISKRFEDVSFTTDSMTKVETGKSYDVINGVAMDFLGFKCNGSVLTVSYMLTNNRTEAVSQEISLNLKSRFFLYDHANAITAEKTAVLTSDMDAGAGTTGSFNIELGEDPKSTLDTYSMVIGAVTFEMNGNSYFIDLSNWFVKEK